jgi:chemotaxis protein histidine kinase CheA
MNNLSKAYWNTHGSSISFLMPISKVDQEKRIVSGWATTDAIDKQGDIVSAEASAKAFEAFRGNVREQHTPLAVGKVVAFKQDKYYDKETEKFHNGVFVDVYISKGAQDTWYKINEGILTGFSIGGSINESEDMYDKNVDQPIRVIKDYELSELSLVDNPANPNANLVSVQKFIPGETMEKNFLENVYWCDTNDSLILSQEGDYSCPQCTKSMTNIGFVESNDINKSETVKELMKSFTKNSTDQSDEAIDTNVAKSVAENNEKEGIEVGILNRKSAEVAEEITKSEESVEAVEVAEVAEEVAEVEEAVEEAAEEVAEEVAEETVEKSDEAEDNADNTVEKSTTPAESNADDLAKSIDEIKTLVAGTVGSVAELAGVVKSIASQLADVKKSVNGVTEEVATVKGNVDEFGQRVEAAEADTAVRKSGDLGGVVQEEKIEKSMWGGRFLSSADLYR